MGDDLAVVLKQLGYDRWTSMGYSLGAGVAFRLAVQHPDTVRRLVLVSGGFCPGRLLSGDAAACRRRSARRWPR